MSGKEIREGGDRVRKRDLERYLTQWQNGQLSKREIDRKLGATRYNGKYVTRLWQEKLGVNTTRTGQVTPI